MTTTIDTYYPLKGARCIGHAADYDIPLGPSRMAPYATRAARARQLCDGCPVLRECAARAVAIARTTEPATPHLAWVGIVVAGVPFIAGWPLWQHVSAWTLAALDDIAAGADINARLAILRRHVGRWPKEMPTRHPAVKAGRNRGARPTPSPTGAPSSPRGARSGRGVA